MNGFPEPPTSKKDKNNQIRWEVLVVLAVLSVVVISQSASIPTRSSQAGQKPISVTSDLVALPVSVTDGKGNFVSGLGRDDFRIYENNQPRKITLFEQADAPVSVGLLVDHSSSMESKLSSVVTAISGFTDSSNPKDEMFVVDFSDDARVQAIGGRAFTSDSAEIQKAVAVSARGRTALYDAVAAGLQHLQLAHWQKRALVIISDGGDNSSQYKYSQVLAQARQSQVSIYAIGLVDEFGEEENPKVLDELCKDTGGVVFSPGSGPAIIDSTARIALDLRQQYMLGFEPVKQADVDLFHRIDVHVVSSHHGKLRVRTRPGYSIGPGKGGVSNSEDTAP